MEDVGLLRKVIVLMFLVYMFMDIGNNYCKDWYWIDLCFYC